jgi:hypothetical protein
MFKGDKIVCIDNLKFAGTNYTCRLTIGKIYVISGNTSVHSAVGVYDDWGTYHEYNKTRFITYNEYRKRKLLKINETA